MELRLQNGRLSAILLTVLSVCVLANSYAIRDEACGTIKLDNCNCFNGGEFEVACPKQHPVITLRVEMTRAEIECSQSSDRQIYTYFPDIKLSNLSRVNIESVKFKYCPMPEGTTIKGILMDKLGMNSVKTLTFSCQSDIQIRREQLKGLTSLNNLRFYGPITDLHEDAFNDVSNITTLELRSNNVHLPTRIFQNLTEIEFLELGSNNLSHLPPGMFSSQHKLKRLNLWNNNLKNLTRDSFIGAWNVTDLDLSSNNIESLPSNIFHDLKHLDNINLNNNNFTELPNGLFEKNENLRKIRLMYNHVDLKTLPDGFLSHLPQLEEVLLRCNIQYLPTDLFFESPKITNMSLQSNRLTSLPEHLFDTQVNLLDLDVSNNQLTNLSGNVFKHTKNLNVLRLSYNNLREIPEELFENLSQLSELYLDNNQLVKLDSNLFKESKSLQVLNMENNRLDFRYRPPNSNYAFLDHPFKTIPNLNRLNLRNNSIKFYISDFNLFNTKLTELDLSHNKISSLDLDNIAANWTQTITLNFTYNRIETISATKAYYRSIEKLYTETYSATNPGMQWIWILDYNPIRCDCGILYFVQFLQEYKPENTPLRIAADYLQCASAPECPTSSNLENSFVKNVKLTDLQCLLDSNETSQKYCPNGCTCCGRLIDETAIFDCSNRGLREVPFLNHTIPLRDTTTFTKYELNITNNKIAQLPNILNGTLGYKYVTKLFARNNSLETVSVNNFPRGLTTLDVSRNHLTNFDTKVLEQFNVTIKNITLGENYWECKCDSDFMKYVRGYWQGKKIITDYTTIRCKDHTFLAEKAVRCPMDMKLFIVLSITFGLVGLFIGSVFALYYKYQQEVKMWLFAHGLCLWFVSIEELDKDKKYDAFISYSHIDEHFVTEELVPKLENGQNPFKLCLHIRDWVAGEYIPNQIAKSVKDSRRTIVVLSSNFVNSVWGRVEFQVAHRTAINENRVRLIVILYGDVDIEKLEPELKDYVKNNTYIKWGDPWFFDKLRYALPHRMNYKSKGLFKSTMNFCSKKDDKMELIKPKPVTPPLTTPPAEQAGQNPMNGNKYHLGSNGLNGHVNGAFFINTNAKQSDV